MNVDRGNITNEVEPVGVYI